MEELERTFLAKELPEGLLTAPSKELLDIYVPSTSEHPNLRIRKLGEKYEITKKYPVVEGDSSRQLEMTVPLTAEEFAELGTIKGKQVLKTRYYYKRDGVDYEIDVFRGDLEGLVLVDVEFLSVEAKDVFLAPEFCLVDVTQEKFVAGGMLCGKTYDDIAEKLGTFGYNKLSV